MNKNIINIVNFIRGCDPRADYSLVEPVKKQLEIAHKYNLPMTFLYQYDAMIKSEFTDLLKNEKNVELGIWLEMSRWIVEKAGLKWRGREGFDWDWFSHVDMTVGYTPEERKLLIDEAMRYFKELFGYYPKTVGSWALDAYSIKYMEEKYGIEAVLICKEQWGTDGYSLWGGYYSEAYYPCKNNAICPAQSEKEQIKVPVFRMLGSDPVDQYMNGIGTSWQNVESMEPVYPNSGADKNWVEWFLKENFNKNNLGFNYCQAGQENAFGWEAMQKGYEMQAEMFCEKRKSGEISFELVSETAREYLKKYKLTPVSTTESHKGNKSSLWYNSRYYRSNLYVESNVPMIRDLFIFDENYRERYLEAVTENESLYYDNLPFVDCFRWSSGENTGGLYFKRNGETVLAKGRIDCTYNNENEVAAEILTECGKIAVTYKEKSVSFEFPENGFMLEAVVFKGKAAAKEYSGGRIFCEYENYKYGIELKNAHCEITDSGFKIVPDGRFLELNAK